MLDIRMFREHADVIRADHDRRGLSHDGIDEVIRLDEAWRKARYDADQLRRKRNEAARGIAAAKKAGDDVGFQRIRANGYAFQIEMNYRFVKHGARIKELPFFFVDRTRGSSKLTFRIGLEALWVVWWLRIADLFGRL